MLFDICRKTYEYLGCFAKRIDSASIKSLFLFVVRITEISTPICCPKCLPKQIFHLISIKNAEKMLMDQILMVIHWCSSIFSQFIHFLISKKSCEQQVNYAVRKCWRFDSRVFSLQLSTHMYFKFIQRAVKVDSVLVYQCINCLCINMRFVLWL